MVYIKMSQDKITTLRLRKSIKDRLGKFGNSNETFQDILIKLMDLAEGIKKRVK